MKTINMNELLLAVYIFLFPGLNWLISPTIQYYIIAIIFLLHIIINKHNLTINKSLLYIVLILVVFLFGTYLFNKNVYLNDYAKKVVLYAILPMILFSKVKKFDSLINYMGIIALIIFALSFSDPFDGYIKYGDYMSYGLFFALPSFILFHVNRKYYNKALYFIPEVLILPGLLYSNRNSILTCLVGVFVLDLLLTSKSLKKIIKYFLIILICSLSILNIDSIIEMLNRITNEDSYAVRAITQMLNGSSNGLAHRDIIWKNAINEIIKNPILGLGVGGYQAKYALYPHNIFLDMYLSFGIFSLIFIKKIFNKALAVLKKPNIFLVYILIMGILPLMFNNTFMAWKYFWIMILFLYRGGDSNEKIINNNTNV